MSVADGTDSAPALAATARPTLADFIVVRPQPTRWADNDIYGHVNNVVYYSLFDTAVNAWMNEVTGVPVWTLPAIGIVAETSCSFYREFTFPEVAHIGIGLERRGRSSVIYRLAAFGESTGASIDPDPRAVGRFVHVYVDPASRRPTAIPDVVALALDQLG